MKYLLIRHKVRDFGSWKKAYDADKGKRDEAGLREAYLLRNTEDPSEVILLFEASDPARATAFTRGADLPARMQNAGVIDQPNIYFLD
jgi:hypothetical protein